MDKPKARVKLSLTIELEVDCWVDEDQAKWHYEENFCVENLIEDLYSEIQDGTCDQCSKSKVRFLEYQKIDKTYVSKLEKVKLLFPHKNIKTDFIQIGTWKCEIENDEDIPNEEDKPLGPNPYNVCVYDTEEDPCCDYCLFCGSPDERK